MTLTPKTAQRLPAEVLAQAADTLRVLAHPHRLKIVELLLEGRHSVGELAEILGQAPSAVSQHLNQMKAHGILRSERAGRIVLYQVIDPNTKTLIGCIRKHCR